MLEDLDENIGEGEIEKNIVSRNVGLERDDYCYKNMNPINSHSSSRIVEEQKYNDNN